MVDDESYCLFGLKTMLKRGLDFKSRCDQALSGEEAIDILKANYDLGLEYKLIFMDLSMPGMSGIETTKEIRRILKEEYNISADKLPTIIGLSGHTGEGY